MGVAAAARLTVEPLGVVLGGAERRENAQAPVDGRVAAGEIHGRGGIQLPAGREQRRGVVLGAVGTAGHAADLIVDLGQVTQLWARAGERNQLSPGEALVAVTKYARPSHRPFRVTESHASKSSQNMKDGCTRLLFMMHGAHLIFPLQ